MLVHINCRFRWPRLSVLLSIFFFFIILTSGDSSSSTQDVSIFSRDSLSTPQNQPISMINFTKGLQGPITSDPYPDSCPSNTLCDVLGPNCIKCAFNYSCDYGNRNTVNCRANHHVNCTGNRTFERDFDCKYCYQLDPANYTCNSSSLCRVVAAPRQKYVATCTIKEPTLCLGRRSFYKYRLCNWTSGYRWSIALLLSITLGGFGVDRFYLGLWEDGIGKLFSFGGLGVWTIVDVILIAIGYIGPADGSLYIY